jgi:tyrosinase
VRHSSRDVEKTTAVPLEYDYDDLSNPCGGVESVGAEGDAMSERRPEMVGATDRPIALTGQLAVAHMSISSPTGPAGGLEATAAPSEVYLNVENITGSGKPLSYAVYLNVPPGVEPDQHPELFAGILPMFGVAESSREDEAHAGGGVQYTLDVTKVVRVLEERGEWNPAELQVSFVPRRRAGLESAGDQPTIRVGRVSLYVA